MDIDEFVGNIKDFQENFLKVVNKDYGQEEDLDKDLKFLIESMNPIFLTDKDKFKVILKVILSISNNYHRVPDFISNICKIIILMKSDIKNVFSNDDIFHIFEKNKRIMLFILEEKILLIDENVISNIKKSEYGYQEYFQPEICPNLTSITNEFNEKRHAGENDDYICKLIQNDFIDEFVTYVNQTNFPLNFQIKPSIFETNQFLLENETSLIEYSAFYGSIQIFNYLYINNVKITSKLWLYAIHGANHQIIRLLEEDNVINKNDKKTFEKCLEESLKCYHNDIAAYISEYLISDKDQKKIIQFSFKYNNFYLFPLEKENNLSIDLQSIFYYACQYEYFDIVSYILNSKKEEIDINFTFYLNYLNTFTNLK